MVEFETIKAEEIKFGRNNFIEISRKKAITDGAENEFISIDEEGNVSLAIANHGVEVLRENFKEDGVVNRC